MAALRHASAKGFVEEARLCLDRGDDVDATVEEDRRPPLWLACWRNHVDVATLLLDRGATMELADALGATALFISAQLGYVEAATLLLDRGAEVDRSDAKGMTPLSVACFEGHLVLATLCLARGADVE